MEKWDEVEFEIIYRTFLGQMQQAQFIHISRALQYFTWMNCIVYQGKKVMFDFVCYKIVGVPYGDQKVI